MHDYETKDAAVILRQQIGKSSGLFYRTRLHSYIVGIFASYINNRSPTSPLIVLYKAFFVTVRKWCTNSFCTQGTFAKHRPKKFQNKLKKFDDACKKAYRRHLDSHDIGKIYSERTDSCKKAGRHLCKEFARQYNN